MRLKLRLILTIIVTSLAALLIVAIVGSALLGARIGRELGSLRLEPRAALERTLLARLGDQLAAPGPDQAARQRLQEAAAAAAAELRRQSSAAHAQELAAALARLAAAAPDDGAARAGYARALDAYSAEIAAATGVIQADLRTSAPDTLFTLTAILAATLSLLIILSVISATIFAPLRAIGAALAAVGEGDLSARLPERVPAEFAPIVAGYRRMTEALSQRQQALAAQLRRTSLLTQLSIELRETPEPAQIAERVLRGIGGSLGLDAATLILTDPQGGAAAGFSWHGGGLQPLEAAEMGRLLGQGVEGWSLRIGSPIAIADVGASERWVAASDERVGSAIVLPISQGAASLGVLTVFIRRPGAFANRDLLLMEGVVAQAGVALGAANRYQEERERGRQAIALLSVSQMLTVERTRPELAATLDELSRSVFQAGRGLLYLTPPGGTLALVPPTDPAALAALPAAARAAAEDAAVAACSSGQISATSAGPAAQTPPCLALPLIHAGQPIGACVLLSATDGEAAFPPSIWSLLTVFTNLFASACANIELVEQLRRYTGQLEGLVERHTLELRRSRDLLRIVFDNLPEGLMLLDADGTLLAANNAFCRGIIGRMPREVVGRGYRQLWAEIGEHADLRLVPQGPAESGAPMIPAADEPFHRKAAAWRVLGTDLVGQQRWYAVDRIPVVGLRGELSQYLERWSDITHQEELQRRLLLHEQMTSLGRLAASVAHEVGNPLQSAMGCLELCREGGGLSESSREYLDLALGELDRMSRTMDSLRSLYRPPQISWERVDLNAILRQVGLFTQRQLDKSRVRLELALDAALPAIVGQPDALRQVFLNLILNAQEAMPGGGTIRIATSRKDTDRLCQVLIQDTGIGMSPEQQEHLFEPFHSGKAQGVGLGLYLSKQIIDQHTGHIEVASRAGQGATITVLLPWSDAGPSRSREPDDDVALMEGEL